MPLNAKKTTLIITIIILALLIIAAYPMLSPLWQRSLIVIQHWQNHYRRDISQLIKTLRSGGDWHTWWLLISTGFLYGILHAAGPGHGKAIISTFLLTQSANLKQALGLAVGGALLQGLSAILWVGITIGALQWFMRDSLKHLLWAERLSYATLIATGLYLLYKAIAQLRHKHHHHSHCHCGQHQPLNTPSNPKAYWAALAAIALRPCSGSILALAVAASWQLWTVGIAMTLAISIGTALTVLILALLSYYGRKQLATRLNLSASALNRFISLIAACGAIILIALGTLLIFASTPKPLGI